MAEKVSADADSSVDPGGNAEAESDEDLVARCQREVPEETAAFYELLNRYEPMVYGTCLRMLGSVPDAEETCQDAFLRVFHKIHQFEGRSTFKTWLFRVVYNFCMTRRRVLATRRERHATVQDEITEIAKTEHQATLADSTVDTDKVHEALAKLREDDRQVVFLRFFSELSLEEIAETLELKLSATKMRLYRAMERFKKAYAGKGEDSSI